MKINKVANLPASPEANTIYLIRIADEYADMFITETDGDIRRIYNPNLVAEQIGNSTGDQSYTASTAIGGGRAVILNSDNQLAHADPTDAGHINRVIGITLQAGNAGALVAVRSSGVIEDSGWNFPPNAPIFLGVGGTLVTTPPTSGAFIQRLGYASAPTKIAVKLGEAIDTLPT